MPIPGLVSLGFTASEDSKYMEEKPNDPAIRKEMEGGFVVSRPRFTRAPTTVITTGFTDISNADKVRLMNFYASMGGGSASFSYTHPVSNDLLTVRFAEAPAPKYAGMGGNHRWDVPNIKLETV